MKIKKIEVKNFKAIKDQSIDLNGCSAIVVAGNNKGKTSLLRGLIDRFMSKKPELILKKGESNGFNIVHLTDGSRIEWKFTEKTESFAYITKDGVEKKTGVLTFIGERYFGKQFDIDKFINASSKEQSKMLQQIMDVDFSEIDERFKLAYDERTYINRKVKEHEAQKPDFDIDNFGHSYEDELKYLEEKMESAKKSNKRKLVEWEHKNNKHIQDIVYFNEKQTIIKQNRDMILAQLESLDNYKNTDLAEYIDFDGAQDYFNGLPKPQEKKKMESLKKPILFDLVDFNNLIKEKENDVQKERAFKAWETKHKEILKQQKVHESLVKMIEKEKRELIEQSDLPDGFEFHEDGILYNGFPLSDNQISSSSKYIAGLKLGSMVIGKVKTLHFDASYLDNKSLADVQEYAEKNDLQLLIERPEMDGGEIKYQII